jgi:hypothetical protein
MAAGCGEVADESDASRTTDAPVNVVDAAAGGPDAPVLPDAMPECLSPFDCDDANRCTDDDCVGFQCRNTNLDGVVVPGAIQPAGDCHELRCVDGAETDAIDNGDLPVDGLDCTKDLCNAGVPSNPPEPSGTDCAAGMCNGSGMCVGCTLPSQCGADSYCRIYTCDASVCGVMNTASGTPLPAGDQIAGDCRELQCNGSGGVMEVIKNGDIPPDDGMECTSEACNMGVPVHPPRPIDTPCTEGGGAFCDGAGACVECNNASQCTGAGVCQTNACVSKMCVVNNEPTGTPCSGGFCNPSQACVECTSDTHCGADEFCDTTIWTCTCKPKDCGDLGATCGVHLDGCGGTIDCDNGIDDPAETDIDCGGPVASCPRRCSAGDMCITGSDCVAPLPCSGGLCGGCTGFPDCDCNPGTLGCPAGGGFCCGTSCPVQHNDGHATHNWYDCVPAFTYDKFQATAACERHFGVGNCANDPGACPGGSVDPGGADGGPGPGGTDGGLGMGGDAVVGSAPPGFACGTWVYSGALTGKMVVNPSFCSCPTTGDATWY